MTAPVLHTVDPVHCVASADDLFLVVWRQPPDEDRVRALRPLLETQLAAHPEGVAYMVIMEASNPVPKPAVRAAGGELFKWLGDRCRIQTVVVEAGSLAATLMRATLRSFAMVSGHQQTLVAGSVTEAAAPTVARMAGHLDASGLEAAIGAIRREYAAALAA